MKPVPEPVPEPVPAPTPLRSWRGPLPVPKIPPPPPRIATWRRILGPVYRAWMKLAHVLAWINTRILLGVVFFVFLTPVRLVAGIFRKDPLQRKPDKRLASYWTERKPEEQTRPPEDYENQY